MLRIALLAALVATALLVLAFWLRSRLQPKDPLVGGLYSVQHDEASYQVAKILAVDQKGIHLRLYSQLFGSRPGDVQESLLSLDRFDAPVPGLGHLPLSRRAFWRLEPVLIRQSTVAPDELDGYEEFVASDGGVFD